MLYSTYQAHDDLLDPWRTAAQGFANWMHQILPAVADNATPHADFWMGGALTRSLAAAADVFARLRLTHVRPSFGIESVSCTSGDYAITEEKVMSTPFATLLRFRKEGGPEMPRVLLVAPMSGHFATLLRDTVRTLLKDHDVYI